MAVFSTRSQVVKRVGVSALLASVAIGSLMVSMPSETAAQSATEIQISKNFDIEAQPLADAISLLGVQAGMQVSANPDLLQNIQSTAIKGQMTVEEALNVLLSGTSLTWKSSGSGIVILKKEKSAVIELPALVIVGEKVERSYQATQTSVGVATQEDIENYKLDDLSDTFNTMANVRKFNSSRGNKGMQIRGISADGISEPENSAPTISVIVDGVAQSSEALRRGSRGTWDMRQIEVLRGPQSTIHGPNAMAGAVVMESNDPTFDWEMAAQGVYGNLDRKDGAIMLSGPIIPDQVAFRLAGEWRNQEKDIDQTNPEDDVLNEDEYWTIRGKLLIEPSAMEDLSVTLMVNEVHDQPATSTVNGTDLFSRTFNSGISGFSTEEVRQIDINNYSAEVAYDLTDRWAITSLTTFQATDLKINTAPGNTAFIRDDVRQDNNFAQDLRLTLDSESGLSGTFGVYHSNNRKEADSFYNLAGFFTTVDAQSKHEIMTYAAYADMRYKFDNGFTIIGGGRVQGDKVRNFQNSDVTGPAAGTPGFDITFAKDMDQTENYVAVLPKFGLTYDFNDKQTAGLTISRGYRQGFSQIVEETNSTIREVKPEFVWTTELSWRDQSIKGLTWGANLFYNSYQNQQVSILDGPILSSFNAEGSNSYGAELEGRANFGNGLSGFVTLGLLKTELGEINASSCGSGSCEGNKFPEAPAVTASLGGTYQHSSGFFASADASYTSEFYSNASITNDSDQLLDDIFLANLRLGYEFKGLKFTAFVENIFDKDYLTGLTSTGSEGTIGDGRTFGLQLDYKF